MADGLPTPKSREQLLSEMISEYAGLTGVNDLNTASAVTQFFDVIARSVARSSGDIFQVIRDYSLDRATGEALNRIGAEERVTRKVPQVASGVVTVTDSSFQKIETKIYSGTNAPNIGSTTIQVSDASSFPATGRLYIGRGTRNIEGPINYTAVAQVGSYWEVTLDTPTSKFHNVSESVIVGQGGTRTVPVGTVVLSPGVGSTEDVNYNITATATLLDGENENASVRVSAQEPGSFGNAPAGAIREFSTVPFPSAIVINSIPLANGSNQESDDQYRDRIKKERLSRGLGTALAIKNAVLGAQSAETNSIVTSNEIDTSDPEKTILFIDNGQGYEEQSEGVGLEFLVDSAIGGEQQFQLATGGQQTSVAKAFLESTLSSPFQITALDRLAILVGGSVSEHIFNEGDFRATQSATAYEIVASINDNTDLLFEASTAENGTKVVLKSKAEDNDFLQLTVPSSGNDAAPALGFPSNEVNTILLYKNRELLNKDGRSAFVFTKNNFEWSDTITTGDTLIISVDGTQEITYTFTDADFLAEGQHSTVNAQNTLSSWVNVINAKITGVTAEINGNQIRLSSNLGSSNRASIAINAASTLVSKGMFSSDLGLSAVGSDADFDISRNTAQIKLKTPLVKGDNLNLGSEFTRAEVRSTSILGGSTTVADTAYVWVVVDSEATPISTGVTADTFLDVLKPSTNIVRYQSTSLTAFQNVEVGDYVIVWSNELNAANRLEGRVNAKTDTTLDVKVTASEWASVVVEGPILYQEGLTVIRTETVPQKLKVDAGVYQVGSIAGILNQQLTNATVQIEDGEIFIITTKTEGLEGRVTVVDFNDPAKTLNFVKNTTSQSIPSQLAFYETPTSDKQFPAFVHGELTGDANADTPDSYINSVLSSEDLAALGLDPSGFLCWLDPYNVTQDVESKECVEVESYSGLTVNIEDSVFNRRLRTNDRFHVVNPYDFGHDDTLIAVLDDDPTGQTFEIPLFRTAVTNITLPNDTNNFRAFDQEAGSSVEFSQFFGDSYSFDNYKALMQAKNVLDPQSATDEDAILYRSIEWGRSGEKVRIGYFYPTAPSLPIASIVNVGETVDIQIFLESGPLRTTTITGTTEWNITISPFDANTELVTYTHSGTGDAPGLGTVLAGDFVSIIQTGEFSPENTGAYKIHAVSASSFTVKRKIGEAVAENNVATLENGTITFFESLGASAAEIQTYVEENLGAYITATLIEDNGTTGAGIINTSTLEDSGFTDSYIQLVDGKNYILSSDLDAGAGVPQFIFKNSLQLPSFDTNTLEAYSFNSGEIIKLVPTTAIQVENFLNILAVTGYTTIGQIKSVDRNSKVQFSTGFIGSNGAVQIAGGNANESLAQIEGSSSTIGTQDNRSMLSSILTSSSGGFHSDQWVKVEASEIQKKNTFINATNSIQIESSVPTLGSSKITLSDNTLTQRFFGRNRYHTRTRGRTFKVEKQGQFVCISWDGNGTQPHFSKTVDIKDAAASTLTIYKVPNTSFVDVRVDSGDMRFDEAYFGDLVTITNRTNDANNGSFVVAGKSADGRTLRIQNENAVDELAKGSFTITDNTTVSGTTFAVGGSNLVAGTDFLVGATADDTASNLAAAISLLPNISSTSDTNVANISSDVPEVTIAISVTGTGATASGAQLDAPVSNTGDVVVTTEIKEGDSVIIGSDFDILNRGIFRLIRKFKNSFYIDNSNAVEEEVTLVDQLVSLGSDVLTDYDIERVGSLNKLKWAGAGAEPSLEDLRPGDVLTLGTDFNADNQGEFSVVDSGEKLQEITRFTQARGVDITTGDHALLYSAADVTEYYLWYNKDGGGGDPGLVGKTGIEIAIINGDTAAEVAEKKADVINTTFSADFTAVVEGDDVVITTVGFGPTTDASNVDVGGSFAVAVEQQGRYNFVDYVNVNGVAETGVTISDVLEAHREAIKFKEYEGTVIGDSFVISDNFLGTANEGSFVVSDVLSENEIIVTGNLSAVNKTLLDTNFNKVYVTEASGYVGYKKISHVAINPANVNQKNIVFDTAEQFQKITELGGVSISAVGKFTLPEEITRGIDSYKFNTDLIAEANRIVYGDPRDNTTYPGVGAAGAEIFIKAPLVRRIEVAVDVRVKTGIPFSTIVEQVRSSVAALINSNPVGNPIPISDIVSNVAGIIGIQAVAISSPQYDAQNDVIRVNSGEKSLVLDIVSDITVSKID